MVEQPIRISVQIAGEDIPAGRLWTHGRGRSESATFAYLRVPCAPRRLRARSLAAASSGQPAHRDLASPLRRSPTAPQTVGDGVSSSEPSSTGLARTSGLRAVSPRSTTCLVCATISARDRCDSRLRARQPTSPPAPAASRTFSTCHDCFTPLKSSNATVRACAPPAQPATRV